MDIELLMEFVFGLVITVVVLGSAGAIILLRPVSKHLGEYFLAKAEERRTYVTRASDDWDRLPEILDGVSRRLQSLEQRQEFTERLLERPFPAESEGGGMGVGSPQEDPQ